MKLPKVLQILRQVRRRIVKPVVPGAGIITLKLTGGELCSGR